MKPARLPRPPAPLDTSAALFAASTGDWSAARAEREFALRLADAYGSSEPDNFTHLIDPAAMLARDLTSSPVTAGGALIDGPIADVAAALRPMSIAVQLGARVVVGRKAPRWPLISTPVTTAWLATETAAAPLSDPVFGQVAAGIHWVGAVVQISRQLLTQSAAAAVVEAELMAAAYAAIDAACFGGTGASGQPLGVANWPGVATVPGATFGRLAGRQMQRLVFAAGGVRNPGALGYVVPPATAETLAERAVIAGSDRTVWEGPLEGGTIAGGRALASQAAPASTVIYGDWSNVVLHFLAPVAVQSNPFEPALFRSGVVQFRILVPVDVVVRQPGAFCVSTAVT